MATTRTAKNTTAQRDADKKPAPARKTAAKKTTTRKPAAKKALPKRDADWMTDGQGYAIIAARLVGIPTPRIQDWVDHHDGTVTRALGDGTLLYNVPQRSLRWQATCRMGAVHTYRIDDPGMAMAARMRAATCDRPHADLTHVKWLICDELTEIGIHVKPRALGDALTRARSATADTQPLSQQDITDGLNARADHDQLKEHPEP